MLLVDPAFSAASLSSIAARSLGRAASRLVRRVAGRVNSLDSSRIRALLVSFRAVLVPSIQHALVLRLRALVDRVHGLGLVHDRDLADLAPEALALRVARHRLRARRRALRDPLARRVAVDASSIPRPKKAR
jgi:hypothetical protein